MKNRSVERLPKGPSKWPSRTACEWGLFETFIEVELSILMA
jgi:hypothetical protein